MKIIICGSISKAKEILKARDELAHMGHVVEIPEGVKRPEIRSKIDAAQEEKANIKIEHDLIKGYFKKIQKSDVVLVINPEKNGVEGYIGGNTFLEMAFAHVLEKPLYCLYKLPNLPYLSEMLAMQPVILEGKLDTFR